MLFTNDLTNRELKFRKATLRQRTPFVVSSVLPPPPPSLQMEKERNFPKNPSGDPLLAPELCAPHPASRLAPAGFQGSHVALPETPAWSNFSRQAQEQLLERQDPLRTDAANTTGAHTFHWGVPLGSKTT